ncbi:protein FAM240C-like isoform X1 [Anomalospiza imberbis]|uniref:protein FAM240C-like isoform X1 n=2 Tax=Anomalospiza imberbis TaxID=187417 RepID=UPI00358E0636
MHSHYSVAKILLCHSTVTQGLFQCLIFWFKADYTPVTYSFLKMSKHTNFKRHRMCGHDAEELKKFWEKVIQEQTKQQEAEEFRLSKSALNKLRQEWTLRLEGRVRQVQAHMKTREEQMTPLSIEALPSPDKTVA